MAYLERKHKLVCLEHELDSELFALSNRNLAPPSTPLPLMYISQRSNLNKYLEGIKNDTDEHEGKDVDSVEESLLPILVSLRELIAPQMFNNKPVMNGVDMIFAILRKLWVKKTPMLSSKSKIAA